MYCHRLPWLSGRAAGECPGCGRRSWAESGSRLGRRRGPGCRRGVSGCVDNICRPRAVDCRCRRWRALCLGGGTCGHLRPHLFDSGKFHGCCGLAVGAGESDGAWLLRNLDSYGGAAGFAGVFECRGFAMAYGGYRWGVAFRRSLEVERRKAMGALYLGRVQ